MAARVETVRGHAHPFRGPLPTTVGTVCVGHVNLHLSTEAAWLASQPAIDAGILRGLLEISKKRPHSRAYLRFRNNQAAEQTIIDLQAANCKT